MNHATTAQRTLLDSLVTAGGPIAAVLQEQFLDCRTWVDDSCSECFYLQPNKDAPALPRGTENPMFFAASAASDPLGTTVLLWHTGGKVDWVEISWDGDVHPTLDQLQVEKEQ